MLVAESSPELLSCITQREAPAEFKAATNQSKSVPAVDSEVPPMVVVPVK